MRPLLALFAAVACQPATKPPADTAAPATVPDLPTASCGLLDHDWVPLEQVGGVVAWEPVPEWSMDLEAIRSFLALSGFADPSILTHSVKTYRVRYETQDRGRVVEATGLVVFPDSPGLSPRTAVYLHPTTGLEDFCAPSARDLTHAAIPIVLASLGYAVAAPDYLGQNGMGTASPDLHPYLIAEPTAVASLDMVRAMWAFADGAGDPELDVSPQAEAVLVGPSQGGGAVFWVERYAPEYLPALEPIGAVVSVPILDLLEWSRLGSQELVRGTVGIPPVLYAMREWYGAPDPLEDVVLPHQVELLEAVIASECPVPEIPDDVFDTSDVFTAEWLAAIAGDDVDAFEPWRCMLAESSVSEAPVSEGTGVPTLAVLGQADQTALLAQQERAIADMCESGHRIVTKTCANGTHVDTVLQSLGLQLEALDRIGQGLPLDGEPCGAVEVVDCGFE